MSQASEFVDRFELWLTGLLQQRWLRTATIAILVEGWVLARCPPDTLAQITFDEDPGNQIAIVIRANPGGQVLARYKLTADGGHISLSKDDSRAEAPIEG